MRSQADFPTNPTSEYAIMNDKATTRIVAEDDADAQSVAEHWNKIAPARAPHFVVKRLRYAPHHGEWEVLNPPEPPDPPKPEITDRVLLTAILYSIAGTTNYNKWVQAALDNPIPEVQL